jgi:hypothetical protein
MCGGTKKEVFLLCGCTKKVGFLLSGCTKKVGFLLCGCTKKVCLLLCDCEKKTGFLLCDFTKKVCFLLYGCITKVVFLLCGCTKKVGPLLQRISAKNVRLCMVLFFVFSDKQSSFSTVVLLEKRYEYALYNLSAKHVSFWVFLTHICTFVLHKERESFYIKSALHHKVRIVLR